MTVFILWIFLIFTAVNSKYFLVKKGADHTSVVKNNQAKDMNDYQEELYRDSDEGNHYVEVYLYRSGCRYILYHVVGFSLV